MKLRVKETGRVPGGVRVFVREGTGRQEGSGEQGRVEQLGGVEHWVERGGGSGGESMMSKNTGIL